MINMLVDPMMGLVFGFRQKYADFKDYEVEMARLIYLADKIRECTNGPPGNDLSLAVELLYKTLKENKK